MANIRSAKKRIRQASKRHESNRGLRSALKTLIARPARLAGGAVESSAEVLAAAAKAAMSALDRAASQGAVHKRQAARRKSRLARQLRKLQQAATTVKAPRAGRTARAERAGATTRRKPASAAATGGRGDGKTKASTTAARPAKEAAATRAKKPVKKAKG